MPKRKVVYDLNDAEEVGDEWDAEEENDGDNDDFDESSYGGGWGGGRWFTPSRPRKVEGGIKARSGRGKFGETWWAGKWVGLLDSFGWSNRLQRGRSYARGGQVLAITIKSGVVNAKVQGSRPSPYNVRIQLLPLSGVQWDKVIAAMSAQALFAATLLAGEMPSDIEDAFKSAGVSLLPRSPKDIEASCSCPDAANPCKHIAAVHYILAEQFDVDPFIIFQMRGRTREQVLRALRALRAPTQVNESRGEVVEAVAPLESKLEHFWSLGAPLDEFRVNVAPPPVSAALIRRLGAPPFWRGPHDFTDVMRDAYEAVSAAALDIA